MAIKAITFDLDDTLWPLLPTLQCAEKATYQWLSENAKKITEKFSCEEVISEREQLLQCKPIFRQQISQLRITSIADLARRSGYDNACAKRISMQAFDVFYPLRQHVTPYSGVKEILKYLSEYYCIAAISNGNADVSSTIIGDYFSFSINAEKLGSAKPDKKIFLAAINEFNAGRRKPIAAEEIVHVGDDFICDIIGAKGVGIKAIWLRSPSAEQQDLQPQTETTDKDISADAIVNDIRMLPAVIAAL